MNNQQQNQGFGNVGGFKPPNTTQPGAQIQQQPQTFQNTFQQQNKNPQQFNPQPQGNQFNPTQFKPGPPTFNVNPQVPQNTQFSFPQNPQNGQQQQNLAGLQGAQPQFQSNQQPNLGFQNQQFQNKFTTPVGVQPNQFIKPTFPNQQPIQQPFQQVQPVQPYEPKPVQTLDDKKALVEALNNYIKEGNEAFAIEVIKQIIDNDIRVKM